jgi:hypothetical protein
MLKYARECDIWRDGEVCERVVYVKNVRKCEVCERRKSMEGNVNNKRK